MPIVLNIDELIPAAGIDPNSPLFDSGMLEREVRKSVLLLVDSVGSLASSWGTPGSWSRAEGPTPGLRLYLHSRLTHQSLASEGPSIGAPPAWTLQPLRPHIRTLLCMYSVQYC